MTTRRLPIAPGQDVAVSQGPVVSYGPTLARALDPQDVRDLFERIDARRSLGAVHVAACRGHVAEVVNVECLIDDGISPGAAVVILQIAIERLQKIHGLVVDPSAISSIPEMTARGIMELCEDTVRRVRARRPTPGEAPFSMSHAEAVRELMAAFISARAVREEANGG